MKRILIALLASAALAAPVMAGPAPWALRDAEKLNTTLATANSSPMEMKSDMKMEKGKKAVSKSKKSGTKKKSSK